MNISILALELTNENELTNMNNEYNEYEYNANEYNELTRVFENDNRNPFRLNGINS